MANNDPRGEFKSTAGEDERTKLVYAYFGLAAYWTQCIEQTFENMLILGTFKKQEELSVEFVDEFYAKLERSKDTMGSLLKKVKDLYKISDSHIDSLSEILANRNHLIHTFFKKHSMKWFTDEGKLEMILECNDLAERIKSTDKELNAYYVKHIRSLGITPEFERKMLEQEIEKEKKSRTKKSG